MKPDLLFVYGILKRGYSLDLSKEGGKYLGEAVLKGANLYRIGDGVGLQLADEGKVHGEVFEIADDWVWRWLDGIEGHPYLYRRELVQVWLSPVNQEFYAWVYVHQLPEYFGELIESGKYESDSEYARG